MNIKERGKRGIETEQTMRRVAVLEVAFAGVSDVAIVIVH
jgi:hypothetical protein